MSLNFIDVGETYNVLPPKVHILTFAQVDSIFGINFLRKKLLNGFKSGCEQLEQAGCKMVYLDGSIVTDKLYPNDFDACWDRQGMDLNSLYKINPVFFDFDNLRQNQKSQFHGEFFPADLTVGNTGMTILEYFKKTRLNKSKGIVSILL